MRFPKLIKAFSNAFRGIWFAFKDQQTFRIQATFAVLIVFLAFVLRITKVEWFVLLLIIAIVLSFELLNTSLEKILDVAHPSEHPIIGNIKDMLAGAVLVAVMLSIAIGVVIFLPRIINLL